jgi:hypothetical protein
MIPLEFASRFADPRSAPETPSNLLNAVPEGAECNCSSLEPEGNLVREPGVWIEVMDSVRSPRQRISDGIECNMEFTLASPLEQGAQTKMCEGKKDFKNPLTTEVTPLILSAREKWGCPSGQHSSSSFWDFRSSLILSRRRAAHGEKLLVLPLVRKQLFSFLCSEIWRKSLFENLIPEFPPQAGLLLLARGSPTDGEFWNGQIAPVTAGAIVSKIKQKLNCALHVRSLMQNLQDRTNPVHGNVSRN